MIPQLNVFLHSSAVLPGKILCRKQVNITRYAGYHTGNGAKPSVSEPADSIDDVIHNKKEMRGLSTKS